MFVGGKLNTPVLTRSILTLHGFPEGMTVGVSFAKLSFEDGMDVFGVVIPSLAIYIAVALSIQNIPEGTAIATPIRAVELSKCRIVGPAVFLSLYSQLVPQ
ncbi:MAG: hypothetical protein J07HQX50_00258 [Haloquadratum sp. J07HQX50]|jgi:Predicted divalent heavy-metal cations transporter|nr:MAG: hypothetical protein J07HQX50_00258 [Haloquadratum sp. J07HQX50]